MDDTFFIQANNEITKLNKGMSKKDVKQLFDGAVNFVDRQKESHDDIRLCTFGSNQKSKLYKLLFIDDKLDFALRLG